ncbi:retrovirus-related pol polyprotein from transposon TNT 1-94 [Tanacetum coccineum]
MSQDVMICVMNSTAVFDNVNVEMQSSESCVKCLDLDADLLNKQDAFNDLSKILEYFENNDLKAQLQAKDTTIYKLKEHIKSIRENDKEEKVKHEMNEIETINIELEHIEKPKPEIKVYSRRPKQIKSGSNAIDVPSSSSLVNDKLSRLFSGIWTPDEKHLLYSANLEVAFRKNTCFIRNLEGVDLLSGSIDTNLYTISLDDMIKTSLICLLSKASKTKSWLWHRRLSHLNFGKSKKSSHQPKAEDTNQEKLYLLHMDLCGPMRVERINWKRTKDEALDIIIKCIKNIQVRLNATVRNIRTNNGTEFVNQTLRDFYENVGISHQTSVARTPQQNNVVERRNRTLVEAARTMLIFLKAPLFL